MLEAASSGLACEGNRPFPILSLALFELFLLVIPCGVPKGCKILSKELGPVSRTLVFTVKMHQFSLHTLRDLPSRHPHAWRFLRYRLRIRRVLS